MYAFCVMIVLGVCVGKCGLFFEKKRGENTREKRGGGSDGGAS